MEVGYSYTPRRFSESFPSKIQDLPVDTSTDYHNRATSMGDCKFLNSAEPFSESRDSYIMVSKPSPGTPCGEVLDMVRRYKIHYPEYKALYQEILSMGDNRDKQKEKDLLEMHAHLAEMKKQIKEAIQASSGPNLEDEIPLVTEGGIDSHQLSHKAEPYGHATYREPQEYPDQNFLALSTADKSTTKPLLSLQSEASSRNNTLQSFMEYDTESDDDEIPGSLQDLHFPEFSAWSSEDYLFSAQTNETLTRPVLSPRRQELVDRIMQEFWAVFDQRTPFMQREFPYSPVEHTKVKAESDSLQWITDSAGQDKMHPSTTLATRHSPRDPTMSIMSGFIQDPSTAFIDAEELQNSNSDPCDGAEDSSRNGGSNSFTEIASITQNPTRSGLGRRGRGAEDDEDPNNEGEKNPKRPKLLPSPPQNQEDSQKYACPYRKRDPRKYCLHSQRWRLCALTPRESVARVKEHLYRQHCIFPCQRCKTLFKDQAAVDSHQKNPQPCQLRDIEHADGITMETVLKLKSKKKAPNQTEADRWRDIFKLLFPDEIIPSPYFETVQEDVVLSPDSRQLAEYEEYCRQQLPRAFRAGLEEMVQTQSQPLEESIRTQLTNMIQDCQDRVFASYRSTVGRPSGTSARNPTGSHSPLMAPETRTDMFMTANSTSQLSSRAIPRFIQPTSPQNHLRSGLDVSDLQSNGPKAQNGSDPSDSGYGSIESAANPGILLTTNDSSYSTSLPNTQANPQPQPTPKQVSANTPDTWDMENELLDMNAANATIDPREISTLNNWGWDNDTQSVESAAWDSPCMEGPFTWHRPP